MPEDVKLHYVYQGRREFVGKKIGYLYGRVAREHDGATWELPPATSEGTLALAKPLLPGASVGSVAAVTHPEGNTSAVAMSGDARPKFAGVYSASDTVASWRAQDVSIATRKSQEALAKKVPNRIDSVLDELRVHMTSLAPSQRTAFLAHIISKVSL